MTSNTNMVATYTHMQMKVLLWRITKTNRNGDGSVGGSTSVQDFPTDGAINYEASSGGQQCRIVGRNVPENR